CRWASPLGMQPRPDLAGQWRGAWHGTGHQPQLGQRRLLPLHPRGPAPGFPPLPGRAGRPRALPQPVQPRLVRLLRPFVALRRPDISVTGSEAPSSPRYVSMSEASRAQRSPICLLLRDWLAEVEEGLRPNGVADVAFGAMSASFGAPS